MNGVDPRRYGYHQQPPWLLAPTNLWQRYVLAQAFGNWLWDAGLAPCLNDGIILARGLLGLDNRA
jgi:hypothetical protein